MVLDCHVHTRDFKEAYKETIRHALEVARRAGVSGMFAMPNPNPPLIDRETVLDYLSLANCAGVPEVFFGCYIALTKDTEQVARAVQIHRELFPRVVGFKIYLGHSTNNLGVTNEDDQQLVIGKLTQEGYTGVLAAHAEKQSLVHDELFDYKRPITHAQLARPPEAEIASIRDILRFGYNAGFKGKLHITHISTPRGVDLVMAAKAQGQDVSCGVTPHHLWYNEFLLNRADGILLKMNPPLRPEGYSEDLAQRLVMGQIDLIETDHAPHTLREKDGAKCASGEPALHAWPLFIEGLRKMKLSDSRIAELTHGNIEKRFGISVPKSRRAVSYVRGAYEFNPWRELEGQLRWKI